MKWKKIFAVIFGVGFSAAVAASSAVGTVTKLYMGPAYGSMVFIAVSPSATGSPACSTNTTYSFVLPLTTALNNQIFALLLAARASNAQVTLEGTGLCDTFSSIETLGYVIY